MKKVFNSLFVIIAAMVTFAGCAKQETDAPATSETKTVQFFANSIETKTVFGTPDGTTYPTLWTAGDKVKILVNLEDVKNTEKTAEIECSEDFRSAKFTSELVQPDAETFTFYSVSPSVALLDKTVEKLYVTIPSDQTPLATSVDKTAQLLYAASETTTKMPSSVELAYQHLTAYGRFTLANLDAESVSSIKLEADFDIAGKWDYFVEDGSFKVRSGYGSKSITLTTSSTTDIWFACAPVDVSNKTLTLTVSTDKGDFVKELNFLANRKFEAGKISKFTVDMTGIGVEQPEDTEWVSTAFADIKAGDQVVIVSTKSASIYALPHNNGSSSAPGVVDVTYSNNKLTKEPAETVIWTVSKSGANYIFHPSGDTSQWLYCTKANNGVRVGTNSNKNFVMDTASGYLKNVETSRYLGVYNNQDWRCYTNTTGNTAGQTFQFFVKSGSGSETPDPTPDPEPETPTYASLADLVAAGQPTTAGTKVNVTLTDEKITDIYVTSSGYRNGVFLQVGDQEVEIYSRNVPEEWVVGGTISGTLNECDWKLYNTTWELCPADWSELTYKAPAGGSTEPEEPEQPGNVTTIKCVFSDYSAGTQYANSEEHKINDVLTLYTTECHFTSELRIYSSSTHNGYVVSNQLPGAITNLSFNAGNKVDVLNVYGSTDGNTWTLVEEVSITSTSYKDYSVDFTGSYTYFKLDVSGANQVRLKSLSVTYQN